MVNTTQQVGASLGVALLNTVFTTALANYIASNGPASAPLGAVYGYNVAFTVSAVLLGAATVAVLALIRNDKRPAVVRTQSVEERELVGAGV